jgi:hypothetical protein
MPPKYRTSEGQVIEANPAQRWIWEAWQQFGRDVEAQMAGKRWALLVNGDGIEGVHHKSVQVVSPDVADHVGIAIEVLGPLASKASTVLFVRGTECHTGSAEESIARNIGATINPICGRHAPDRWDVEVGGVLHAIRHHIPATTRDYLRGSQMSIALVTEQASAAGAGRPIPRVVLAAHRHTAGVYRQSAVGVCVVTPPWQLLTRFGHKVVSHAASQPQVGGMILTYSGNGALPDVQELIYQPPVTPHHVL